MQLKFPTISGIISGEDEKVIQDTPFSLDFSEVGPGRFQALVPVSHSVDSGTLQSTYPVTVESDTTDAQKSRRRVMIKVSIPYRRAIVDPSTNAVSVGGNSGEVSVHMVVSAPKALIQDLTVPDPSNPKAAQVASSTLTMTLTLLRALSCTLGVSNYLPAEGPRNTESEAGVDIVPVCNIANEMDPPGAESNTGFETVQGGYQPKSISLSTDTISGITRVTSTPGYTVLGGTTKVGLQDLHFDPIVRGLFGLRPIEENSEVVANATFGLG